MRIVTVLTLCVCLYLVSCQKERDFANQNAAGNTSSDAGGLLVKMVQKTGTDSLITTYGYDANKRLITLTRVGIDDQGNPLNTQFHFHRNAAGIITDYSSTSPDLVATGVDSIIHRAETDRQPGSSLFPPRQTMVRTSPESLSAADYYRADLRIRMRFLGRGRSFFLRASVQNVRVFFLSYFVRSKLASTIIAVVVLDSTHLLACCVFVEYFRMISSKRGP